MKKFAVIGHPVAHSLSPRMHEANFKALGFAASYEKFDVPPENLAEFVRTKAKEGYLGLNVTIPHKVEVINLLNKLDESVVRYGACNTVKFEQDGTITGYNTDVIGFVASLAAHGISLPGKRVVILGCGGAGAALATACVYEGAAEVKVAAQHVANAERLVAKLHEIGREASLSAILTSDSAAAREADLIVNATPVGLKPDDKSVLPREAFRPGQFVLDIIPTGQTPPTAALAIEAGAAAADGLEFLVAQGAESFRIWTGLEADQSAMLAAIR